LNRGYPHSAKSTALFNRQAPVMRALAIDIPPLENGVRANLPQQPLQSLRLADKQFPTGETLHRRRQRTVLGAPRPVPLSGALPTVGPPPAKQWRVAPAQQPRLQSLAGRLNPRHSDSRPAPP